MIRASERVNRTGPERHLSRLGSPYTSESDWEAVFTPLTSQDPHQIGKYLLRARIGNGGMGTVYFTYTPGGRPVALKVIRPEFAADPDFRRRFATEVTIARQVQGPYTAPVIDYDAYAPQPWLATAYVAAPSLAVVVAKQGALPPETVLALIAGVAEALQAIHAVGVIHRDLKPGNVILAADGPRVIDFGISRAIEHSSLAITKSGAPIGTPPFMAPEQVQGISLGTAADVFSLGSMAYYAVTGDLPFGADVAVFSRIEHKEPDWDRCPTPVREILQRCMKKQPDVRPTLTKLIELCSESSTDARLGSATGWLPPTVTAELTRYSVAPPLQPLPLAATRAGYNLPAAPPKSSKRDPRLSRILLFSIIAILSISLVKIFPDIFTSSPHSGAPSAAATSPSSTSSPPATSPSAESASQTSPSSTAPSVLVGGRVTLSMHEGLDADRGELYQFESDFVDFALDSEDFTFFAGKHGSIAPAANGVASWETCSRASGFGLKLRIADLRNELQLCGTTNEGRTVAITIAGFQQNRIGGLESITFRYGTWSR